LTPPLANALAGFVVGGVVGSFVTNWALRRARGEQALHGRSACESCNVSLTFVQTAPFVSYPALRGRCAGCRAAIDPLHPIGEMAGGLVGWLIATAPDPIQGALLGALGFASLAAAVIDAKTLRLPKALTGTVAIFALALALTRGALIEGVLAGLANGLFLLAVRRFGPRHGAGPGLGLADVKFTAGLAVWLGAFSGFLIWLTAVLGLAFAIATKPARGSRWALGPWIALAALIIGLGREYVVGWTSWK
jgi:leader peptidase (prepilin peptidase)/N-methyltransferase